MKKRAEAGVQLTGSRKCRSELPMNITLPVAGERCDPRACQRAGGARPAGDPGLSSDQHDAAATTVQDNATARLSVNRLLWPHFTMGPDSSRKAALPLVLEPLLRPSGRPRQDRRVSRSALEKWEAASTLPRFDLDDLQRVLSSRQRISVAGLVPAEAPGPGPGDRHAQPRRRMRVHRYRIARFEAHAIHADAAVLDLEDVVWFAGHGARCLTGRRQDLHFDELLLARSRPGGRLRVAARREDRPSRRTAEPGSSRSGGIVMVTVSERC